MVAPSLLSDFHVSHRLLYFVCQSHTRPSAIAHIATALKARRKFAKMMQMTSQTSPIQRALELLMAVPHSLPSNSL
jgi:hypothetical protein